MRRNELRAALYHRLYWLVPLLSNRAARGFWRVLVWTFWVVYFSFVVLVLVLRYSVLPNIETYRPDIERLSSRALGQAISIGRIEANWEGINPDLTLLDVRVADAQGRPALAFSRIEAILSWWSVPSAQLKLRLLRIDEPTLNLRRDSAGHYFIAGLPLTQDESDSDISDWVLAQRHIRIRGAKLVWDDELRQAPTLVLQDLNFALDNDGRHHRFGLTALPPEGLASKVDLRGDFRGADLDRMELWSGQAYAVIDYADLSVWRQWIDYPVALPHGRGALQTWLKFADGGLREVIADVALQDVSLRFSPELPTLELEHMSGRLSTRFLADGFEASGRRVELATRPAASARSDAIRIEPSDFRVAWRRAGDAGQGIGEASAGRLDLAALASLAGHFPLDAQSRQLLVDYAPRGQVNDLGLKWTGNTESLQSYALKAGFADLALKANGYFPGFSGLAGALEFTEKGGSVSLQAQKSTIDLPSVFPESLIALDSLNAQAHWKISQGVLDAEVSRAEFAGPDAAGSALGRYRNAGSGPGNIDLTAALTRADARAVWRYMPHVVNASAREWLHASLISGGASEAKLVLKGDLEHFPFLDKTQGQFLVTVKANDVVLDYGKDWPRIDGIHGDLRFEGNGMHIDVQRGAILGARLSNTQADIPDFDAPLSTLLVKGKADGPTSEFLKFIDQSPVAERIDHFTEDMRAAGDGHLDLSLQIPLSEAQLAQSKIDGAYKFANNEVTVDPGLPALKQVDGSVQFSGTDLRVPEINATLFGGPLKIRGGTQKNGRVLITANGSINIEQVRKTSDSPLLAGLSGSSPYRGEVRINKRNADLVIDTTLVGLASSLPEPFRKSASESLPLHFEKRLLTAAPTPTPTPKGSNGARPEPAASAPMRDQISATLGNVVAMQLIRSKKADGFVPERGAIAVGQPLQMPESGIKLGVSAKSVDLDAWQRLLASASDAGGHDSTGAAAPLIDGLTIRSGDLLVLGRHYRDVDLAASLVAGQWRIRLASRQASGDLIWDNAGNGKLTARLKQLTIDSALAVNDPGAHAAIEKLPAVDFIADDFSLGTRRFGRLELQASNSGGLWMLNRIQASNPFGTLTGSGQWQLAAGKSRTQLAFKIDSSDLGKLLERLGYPGTLRGGTGVLEGKIGWDNTPTELEYDSLSGEMNLTASKGSFVKLDPGATGKLLGLISLQSLPRRITLDFRDVFSEGFTFDSIASKVVVQNGLMRTERLQIDGPSARVVMRGEADLKHETQRLNVNVQPELGGTAALGIALVHPIAGVATWVAHKVLQNPLNHMFGFDYLVTGSWDDPKVEKLSGGETAPAVPRLPTIPNTAGAANEPSSK